MSEPRQYKVYVSRSMTNDDSSMKKAEVNDYTSLCFICNKFNDNPELCDACGEFVHVDCGESLTRAGEWYFYCRRCTKQ